MDSASVHKMAAENVAPGLRHTTVVHLPKNTTSRTQPLDEGIIQTFKLVYRQYLSRHVMYRLKNDFECDPLGDVNIALVMTWVMKPWKSVRPRTISQCFAKCGFIMPGDGPAPPTELDSTFLQEELALQAEKDTVKYPPARPAS